MNSHGVILWNAGTKMLVRAAVCINTLRRHYAGSVTLIVDNRELNPDDLPSIEQLCGEWDVKLKLQDTLTPEGKHCAFLNKCLLHKYTPYDFSLLIDLDCIVLDYVTPMLRAAEEDEFAVCQFADWTVNGKIKKRIANWDKYLPHGMMVRARDYPAAINTGVFAFKRDSLLMRDWYDYAVEGRETFIPDETCCQAMIASYRHRLMPPEFNTSCRYGDIEKAKVIHFHGRKHCRFNQTGQFLFNSDIWYREFEQVRHFPFVGRYIEKDRQLREHLPTWDAVKQEVIA